MSWTLLVLVATATTRAVVLSVDPVTGDDTTGQPYRSIQAALAGASDGDTVELTAGNYSGPGNTRLTISNKGVTLRSNSQKYSDVVIDCQGTTQGIYVDLSRVGYKNVSIVGISIVNCTGIGSGSAVRAGGSERWLTIRDVYIGGSTSDQGSAVAVFGASVLLIACTFENNVGKISGGHIQVISGNCVMEKCTLRGGKAIGGAGGAVAAFSSDLQVRECVFERNTAYTDGGAIWGTAVRLVVLNSTFDANGAGIDHDGGAMFLIDCEIEVGGSKFINHDVGKGNIKYERISKRATTNPRVYDSFFGKSKQCLLYVKDLKGKTFEVSNVTFADGDAKAYAAVRLDTAAMSFTHCIFDRIKSKKEIVLLDTGQVSFVSTRFLNNKGWISMPDAQVSFQNCSFDDNMQQVLKLENSKVEIRNCDFRRNSAKDANGVVFVDKESSLMVKSSTFMQNQAAFGGAIYLETVKTGEIVDTNFTSNTASESGGAIFVQERVDPINIEQLVVGCMFKENKAPISGPDVASGFRRLSLSPTGVSVFSGAAVPIQLKLVDSLGQIITADDQPVLMTVENGISQNADNLTLSQGQISFEVNVFGKIGQNVLLKLEGPSSSIDHVAIEISILACLEDEKVVDYAEYDVCVTRVEQLVSQGMVYVFIALGVLGWTICAFFYFCVLKFWATAVMVTGQPWFLCICLVGGALSYLATMIEGIIASRLVSKFQQCSLGLSLQLFAQACILSSTTIKAWRINKILNAKLENTTTSVTENKTRMALGGVIFVAFVFFVLQNAAPPVPLLTMNMGDTITPTVTWECPRGLLHNGLLIPSIVLVVCLLAASFHYAIAIRNVNTAFNESSLLAFAVFNMVFFGIVAAVSVTSIQDPSVSYFLSSFSFTVGVTSTLGLMFAKKCYIAFFEPAKNDLAVLSNGTLRNESIKRKEKVIKVKGKSVKTRSKEFSARKKKERGQRTQRMQFNDAKIAPSQPPAEAGQGFEPVVVRLEVRGVQ